MTLKPSDPSFDEPVYLRLVKSATINLKNTKNYGKFWSNKPCSYQPDINNQDPANEQKKELEDKFERLFIIDMRLQVSVLLHVHIDYVDS